MIDYSQTFLDLKASLTEYHQKMIKNQFMAAYELAEAITDLAQQLEDITRKVSE